MINYIRRSIHLNTCPGCGETFDDQDTCLEHVKSLGHHVPQNVADWDQPQFYFPIYENDNLLCGLEVIKCLLNVIRVSRLCVYRRHSFSVFLNQP